MHPEAQQRTSSAASIGATSFHSPGKRRRCWAAARALALACGLRRLPRLTAPRAAVGGGGGRIPQFLKDLNNGVSPTRDELDYVMTAADRARAGDGEVGAMLFDPRRDETPRGTAGHGHRRRVSRQQLVYAVDAWKAYKDNEAIINAFFDRCVHVTRPRATRGPPRVAPASPPP